MKNEEKSLKYLLYNEIISRFFYRDGLLIPKTRNVIFKQVIKVRVLSYVQCFYFAQRNIIMEGNFFSTFFNICDESCYIEFCIISISCICLFWNNTMHVDLYLTLHIKFIDILSLQHRHTVGFKFN